ncbi:ABC transporter permease [Echinicola sp. 20G]|uniref:ABC transporter permease n=1 Tax=Echinicola sp. 20G TaxID=2781961 RepID=UPI0019109F34|nr:ABC transporter permease [Echinicola sp. 20G]
MDSKTPPKNFVRFLRWFCNPELHPFIEGDLFELYNERVKELGKKNADRKFVIDVIRLFRPGIIRGFEDFNPFGQLDMYKNYFIIAWRNLLKQKLYSFINIFGLTIGLTCFILMFLYVKYEFSYDNFFPKKERIYRVYQQQKGADYLGSDCFALTPTILAESLENELPEVELATTIFDREVLIKNGDDVFFDRGYWTNNSFFEIFDHEFIQGGDFGSNTHGIVLAESYATKMFPFGNAVGKVVVVSNFFGEIEYVVTGVVKAPPENTSLGFNYLINIQSDPEYSENLRSSKWAGNSAHTFLLLKQGGNFKQTESKIASIIQKHMGLDTEEEKNRTTYFLQSLSDIHLFNKAHFDLGPKGDPKHVHYFMLIAAVILSLACINYINLAMARSIKRAKEVGIRKVVGAIKWQLISQFIIESIVLASIAMVLALILSILLLPSYSNILERDLELNLTTEPLLVPILLGILLMVGLVSGAYPALFLSRLNPLSSLKGKFTEGPGKIRLRSLLVVVQYAASIILIIGSLVIYLQFEFVKNKDLGYNKEQIIILKTLSQDLQENLSSLKTELKKHHNISSLTVSNALPYEINSSTNVSSNSGRSNGITTYISTSDHDYVKTLGLKMASGRFYSEDIQSERDNIVINESAAKAFGWDVNKAVGKEIFMGDNRMTIIGVLNDFHMFSLHLKIQPLLITLRERRFNYVMVKVSPNDLDHTVSYLKKTVEQYSEYPFNYQFMDTDFERLYKADLRFAKFLGVFTIISIAVASLGLFGLAAYTTKQRTKEIGIRKVLGASIRTIMGLIAVDYVKMVLMGFLIAVPLAWYLMNYWLKNYAYKINLEWWIFIVAGILATVIAVFSVSFQSIKAAMTNPVDSLRND